MQKHLLKILMAVSALAMLAMAPCTASAATYAITDLGSGAAYAINENGQVAGTRMIQGYTSNHAVIWNNGVFTDLGTLDGDCSLAYGINNLGQAVGTAMTGSTYHAVLYSNGTVKDLGTYPGDRESTAYGINDSGQVVGKSILGSTVRTIIWNNGTPTRLYAVSSVFEGSIAINNSGQVAGQSRSGSMAATIWYNGTKTVLPQPAGSTASFSNGINEMGQVVGYGYVNGPQHAALWANDSATDLGTMGGYSSQAYGINDLGQVVGQVMLTTSNQDNLYAFVYENGVMADLNSLLVNGDGWVLENARDINDKGQIVGYGLHNGVRHAYVLNPVPIPPAFWMFGSGLAGLGFLRRRFFSV